MADLNGGTAKGHGADGTPTSRTLALDLTDLLPGSDERCADRLTRGLVGDGIIEQAHIIGASMGGMISQVVGLEHPSRVLTLTPIMSTPDPGAVMDAMEGREASYELSPPTPEVMASMLSTLTLDWSNREAVLQNRLSTFRALAGSAHAYDEPGRAKLFASEIDRAIDFASTQNHGPAIEKSERWHQRLGDLDVPTLVIHGTEDGILPYDHGEALARSIPSAKLLTMEGVGHELPEGEMDRVIPAILEHTR